MRTQTMIQYEGWEPLIRRESKTYGYTLDTCFLINAWKYPNIASYFKNHVHLGGKKIYINEVSIREAERIGYDVSSIILKLRKLLSVKIIISQVTTAVRVLGNKLESCCQFLHSGDSAILAFAKTTKTTLVTYDKNLIISCAKLGVKSLNPTKMMSANFAWWLVQWSKNKKAMWSIIDLTWLRCMVEHVREFERTIKPNSGDIWNHGIIVVE